MMKTKQLGIFACVAALVLIVSFSSSTVFTKGGGGGGPNRQVVIFDCADGEVGAIDQTDLDLMIPVVSCANTVAFLLNNKYKVEAAVQSEIAVGSFLLRSVNYTMVKK